jgi:hypothetical protein
MKNNVKVTDVKISNFSQGISVLLSHNITYHECNASQIKMIDFLENSTKNII